MNTLVGKDAGYYITSGTKNTVIGKYNGNQGGLDIRTASNYIVLSDGDGNPRGFFNASGSFFLNGAGQTTYTASHNFYNITNGDWAAALVHKDNTPYGLRIQYSGASPNTTAQPFWAGVDSTTTRGSLYSNGGLANYSANNVNLSDRREKTNFAPAKSYLDTICAIPVQTFNYIDQNMEEDPGLTLGVVAQDVQAVAPELVSESNWGTKEDPKMRLSIYQTDLQYALMKCIQELKSELDSVKAELATLKGN